MYGTRTVGTSELWAPAQPFDFAGWTLLASAPSPEGLNLSAIYSAGEEQLHVFSSGKRDIMRLCLFQLTAAAPCFNSFAKSRRPTSRLARLGSS